MVRVLPELLRSNQPEGWILGVCDEGTEAQPLVQFAHENQAAIGGDPGSLELDLHHGVEREREGLVLGFTYWVRTSPASSS